MTWHDPRSPETRVLADILREQQRGSSTARGSLRWAKIAGIASLVGVVIGAAALVIAIIAL